MIVVEPLRTEHVERFVPGRTAAGSWTPENIASLNTDWIGKAAAVCDGGRILALFGMGLADRRGYVWLLLDDAARRRPMTLTRWAIRTLDALRREYGVRSFVGETYDGVSARWAGFLGVEPVTDDRVVMSDGSSYLFGSGMRWSG